MHRIAHLIQANLNLKTFVPLLVLALGTTAYGLFWSVDHFAALTGGLSFMDMQPLLTSDTLFAQISSYPEAAIDFYLGWSLFDWAWPLITFTTMLFITAWLLTFMTRQWQARFWVLVAAAYLTVLMDWLENVGFVLLVLGLPEQPGWLAGLSLGFHAAKLTFNMLFNLGFWILLIAVVSGALRQRFA